MDANLALKLHEDILHFRKTELWNHLQSIGSPRQVALIDKLVEAGLESTDQKVRILAQHVVVSRDVWGELTAIDRQAEEILTENMPSDGTRSEFEYDAP